MHVELMSWEHLLQVAPPLLALVQRHRDRDAAAAAPKVPACCCKLCAYMAC